MTLAETPEEAAVHGHVSTSKRRGGRGWPLRTQRWPSLRAKAALRSARAIPLVPTTAGPCLWLGTAEQLGLRGLELVIIEDAVPMKFGEGLNLVGKG
jgi:hypothetical protein